MRERRRMLRWWWGWDVERIERWLEGQEAEGWNLEAINGPGIVFTFVRGEARKVAYRFDYQINPGDDYRKLFEDAGWSLTASGSGWFYWRMPFADVRPEIFTDAESLVARNHRQMWLLALILVVQVPTMAILARPEATAFQAAVASIQLVMVVILGTALVKFFLANRRLRSRL